MDCVRNFMHATQRLDQGAMASGLALCHHDPNKRNELSGLQETKLFHSIIQGTLLAVAAVAVIILLAVLFLLKRRRRIDAGLQIKDSEANGIVELPTNTNFSRKLTVPPPRPYSPYIGDRFPDGVIGHGQSPRVPAQPDHKNSQQNGDGEFHEIDLGEMRQLA